MTKPWEVDNKWLKSHILEYRNGNQSACLEVIDKFSRLISIFSRRLTSEDSLYDLALHLLELMNNIDLDRFDDDGDHSLQYYIAKCIKCKYIKLSQNENREQTHLKFVDSTVLDSLGSNTFNDRLIFNDYLALLTDKQKKVIVLHYVYGYNIQKIANLLHISRMAANELKRRALCVLRKEINYEI